MRCVPTPASPDRVLDHHVAGNCASQGIAATVVRTNRKRRGFVVSLSERLRQSSGVANKSKDAHLSVKCFKLRQLVGASNIPTGRTPAVLSCYQAVDVLCLAGPALSFANFDQAKTRRNRLGSKRRADSLQSLWRPLGRSSARHVRQIDRGKDAGAAAAVPVARRSDAGPLW